MNRASPGAKDASRLHRVPPPGIAALACDRWADGSGRLALLHLRHDGSAERVTFDALRSSSARLAEVLRAHGVARRDRVAIRLDPGPEALVALLATLRIGAIALPLPRGAGPWAVHAHGCGALVTDAAGCELFEARPAPRLVLCTDGRRGGALSFWEEAGRARDDAAPAATGGGDPALLLPVRDAAGRRRAVLHAHRAAGAGAAGFAALHRGLAQPGGLFWSDADWAEPRGLLDGVLPALFHGVAVLAHPALPFDPERAMRVMRRMGVRNLALSPAALAGLRGAGLPAAARVALRSLATEARALDRDLQGWAQARFGVAAHGSLSHPEYGVMLVQPGPALPGRLGHPAPGRRIALLGADGQEVAPGRCGVIAIHRADPGLGLGYWGEARGAGHGRWVTTGLAGVMEADGSISLPPSGMVAAVAREVEGVLLGHPAVARAAVVVPPAAQSGRDATAIVVPREGARPGPALAAELRGFLGARLAGGLYPRRVAFARDLAPPGAALTRGALEDAIGLGGAAGDR